MYREAAAQQNRIKWLVAGIALAFSMLLARLVYLQVLRHDHFASLAAKEQSRKYDIPAARGQIYALDGTTPTPLALNESFKLLYADPRFVRNKAQAAIKLAALTGDRAEDYERLLNTPGSYIVLNSKVPLAAASQISKLSLEGVGLSDKSYRVYPEGSLAAQVLGFVNADGTGQYGIEGFFNKILAGTDGHFNAKTDTFGIPIATSANIGQPAVDGASITLTIDRNIQAQAEKALSDGVKNVQAKSGSVIVMDPNTGAIKAMANYPTFDPAHYGDIRDYQTFSNGVLSHAFEPGSGFKTITMAAGLDTGKVKPDTTYNDTGEFTVDGYSIHNAENNKFGTQTMTDVIQKSLNTGAMFVLRMLGGDPAQITLPGKKVFYDYVTKHFSFGSTTGVEQTGEASGRVNAPTNQAGNNVNFANMTFGQGLTVTVLQMTQAVAAIANGGTMYKPYLVQQVSRPDGSVVKSEPVVVRSGVITKKTADDLAQMMIQVVQHGSGYLAKMPGYDIAGKTGTAQIPRLDGKGYEEGKNIGSFVGFAPVGAPRFIMMVRIDEPKVSGFAESTTVPVFANIAKFLFNYYGIPPANQQ